MGKEETVKANLFGKSFQTPPRLKAQEPLSTLKVNAAIKANLYKLKDCST